MRRSPRSLKVNFAAAVRIELLCPRPWKMRNNEKFAVIHLERR
jgi:hypothetical protein